MIRIVSIDIGIIHVAICTMRANEDYSDPEIERMDCMDSVSVERIMKTYEDWFEAANHVMIDGPPAVKRKLYQLLRTKYGEKKKVDV